MIAIRLKPRPARPILLLAVLLGAAAPARGQAAQDLRPSLADEDPAGVPPPIVAQRTTLEVNPPEDEPASRPRRRIIEDPYAALGLRLGGLSVFPLLGLGGTVTDNVRRSDHGPRSDAGFRLRPGLRVESDWSRHAFQASGKGDFTFYAGEPDFDDAGAELDTRLTIDVRHTTRIDLEGDYTLTQSSPSDREVPDAAVETREDQHFGAAAALTHDMGRLEVRLRAGAARQVYDDVKLSSGGSEDNSDRNYVQPEIGLRLTYETSPAVKPFVEFAYRPRIHDERIDRNGLHRDSHGYAAGAGIVFDLSGIWVGEMALTYDRRDYEDGALASVDAVGLAGDVTWHPTALTSLMLATETSIDESSSAISGGSRNTDIRLGLTHALRENLDILAGAGVNYDDAEGSNDDLTVTSRLGLAWQANTWFAWTAGYDFTWFDSSQAGSDYREHRLSAGIEIRR